MRPRTSDRRRFAFHSNHHQTTTNSSSAGATPRRAVALSHLLPKLFLVAMAGQSRKWMILVATIWIQAFTGTNFDFSQYSSTLKSALNISQVQLNYLATANDMGKLFGWSSGFALMYLPLSAVMFVAALMGLVGYGLQWLLINRLIDLPYFLVRPLYRNLRQWFLFSRVGYIDFRDELVISYSSKLSSFLKVQQRVIISIIRLIIKYTIYNRNLFNRGFSLFFMIHMKCLPLLNSE